jgi:squalene synthase HpnC
MAAASLAEAFAYCEARAKSRDPGFLTGLLVPRDKRPFVHALSAFAWAADDFADAPIYEGLRREKLDQWETLLRAAYRGEAEGPIFVALGETVRRLRIPEGLLLDLISGFRQDAENARYASWEELVEHCRLAANPVGRLALLVFDETDPELLASSDAVCTGLELASRWQSAALDYARGRVYLPENLMRRHGVTTWDFSTGRVSDGWRGLMAELIERTRELLVRGRPLCDRVGVEMRFLVRLAWLLGTSILDRIEAVGGDVFRRRPEHGPLDRAALAWRAWRWPSR